MSESVSEGIGAGLAGGLIWADYVILAVVLLSALLSLFRGFVREALSLFGWIAAIWLAFTFASRVEPLLAGQISIPSLRHSAAFAIVFVITLIVTAIVNVIVGRIMEQVGLSGTDRMLGMLFGAARGVIIVGVLVLLAGLTELPRDPWWGESVLVQHFERAVLELRDLLPPEIAGRISY